jgi:hypothetical protein
METVSTMEQKSSFQEAFCLLPKPAIFPKGILLQRNEPPPPFSYEYKREVVKN